MMVETILEIVLREMTAYASGWSADWSGFDGRTLSEQIGKLRKWAEAAIKYEMNEDYTEGTKFADDSWSG